MELNILTTTARDLLLMQVLSLVAKPFSSMSETQISQTLDRFRLQLKSGVGVSDGKTARETLCADLTNCWRTADKNISSVIDRYRMQLKVQGKAKKSKISKSKQTDEKMEFSPTAIKTTRVEPLAGGPQKRSRDRGQCPKCRSMGVVLAHSYSGDDYFSCIYCGFQAYKASLDSELDLPLVAELLGRRFDDHEHEKVEMTE